MTIKVVCLNVWIGGILLEPLAEFCQQQAADIYLFQEVFHNSDPALPPRYRTYSELKQRLNLPFGHFAPAFIEELEGQGIVQGNAILSQFPLQEVANRFYDVPFSCRINQRWAFPFTPRNLEHVTAQVGETQLHVLNTQGIWGQDGLDSPRRLQMGQDILTEVGSNRPVILGGDFNIASNTQTIAQIEKSLVNVFKDELTTSFNLKHKDLVTDPGYATAVVDTLFVSSDIRVLSHECPAVDVSDHLPLVMEVEI